MHVILRNALDGVDDPRVLRAAEMFFRTQRVTVHDGSLIAADEETIGGVNTAPVSPLVSMLGHPGRGRYRRHQRRQRRDLLGAQRPLRHGDRSHRRARRASTALAEAMRRWIVHLLGVEVAIEPLKELREAAFTWYVGLDADATKIGDQLWDGEDIDEATMARVVGLFQSDLQRSGDRARQGARRAGLSDFGDDARQADPHEAAKPGDRPADPASGGGRMSVVTPLTTIAVGVVVERSKGASLWSDFLWRPVSVLTGVPETPPWTQLSDDGERATFYAGAAEIELYRSEARTIATTDDRARRCCGWCCDPAEGDPPYALPMVTADPAEGEALAGIGDDIVETVPMPEAMRDAVAAFVSEHHVERAFSKRRRDRADPEALGAAAADARSEQAMSEPENFLERWSRRKQQASVEPAQASAAKAEKDEASAAAPADPGRAQRAETGRLRSRRAAVDRIDRRRHRHARFSSARRAAGIDPCGASSRLVERPGHPRFRRPGGERVGLQRSQRHARLRADHARGGRAALDAERHFDRSAARPAAGAGRGD